MTLRAILERRKAGKRSRRAVGKTVPVLVLAVAVGVVSCSSKEESILEDAGKCGNIHFHSTPRVVSAQRVDGAGGDMLIQLVTDIPDNDVQSFEDLSGLHTLTPGVSDVWVDTYWKGSDLADAVRANGQASIEHSDESAAIPGRPARWIVIREKDAGETRVYIRLAC